MRNCLRLLAIVMVLAVLGTANAAGTLSARDGSILGGPPPSFASVNGDIIEEECIDVAGMTGAGWVMVNNSDNPSTSLWFQGNSSVFPAASGNGDEYCAANYQAVASGTATISLWLLSPEIDMDAVGSISFMTRTVTGSSWPDRLQVRYSTAGASSDCGTGAEDVGVFTELIDDINAGLAVGGYPEDWTEFAYDETAVGGGSGRLALRYYVASGGPSGTNSNYIGVDSISVDSGGGGGDGGGTGTPATSTWGVILLIALFMTVSLFYLRKRGSQNA